MTKMMVRSVDGTLKEIEGDDTYKMISNNVGLGGMIETIPFFDRMTRGMYGITVFGNEEAKLIPLEPSIVVTHEKDVRWKDILCGPLVFTRTNDEGETVSLTDEDITLIKETLSTKVFTIKGYVFTQLNL